MNGDHRVRGEGSVQMRITLTGIDLGPAQLRLQPIGIELNEDQLNPRIEMALRRAHNLRPSRTMNKALAV